MCDLVLSLREDIFFPLLFTPTPQTSSTKLNVCFRFQSEKETGDRNYAIGYYLKEKKVTGRGWYRKSLGILQLGEGQSGLGTLAEPLVV